VGRESDDVEIRYEIGSTVSRANMNVYDVFGRPVAQLSSGPALGNETSSAPAGLAPLPKCGLELDSNSYSNSYIDREMPASRGPTEGTTHPD